MEELNAIQQAMSAIEGKDGRKFIGYMAKEILRARRKLKRMAKPEIAFWLRKKAWGYMIEHGIEMTEEEFKEIWDKEEKKFLQA